MADETKKKVKGVVTGITNFGAFVLLEDGSTGLIHISRVSDRFVKDIHDFLTIGQSVEATLLSKDENGKIALSLKEEDHRPLTGGQPAMFETAPEPKDFESMLDKFKSVSEERLSDLRKIQNGGKSSYRHKK